MRYQYQSETKDMERMKRERERKKCLKWWVFGASKFRFMFDLYVLGAFIFAFNF